MMWSIFPIPQNGPFFLMPVFPAGPFYCGHFPPIVDFFPWTLFPKFERAAVPGLDYFPTIGYVYDQRSIMSVT